MKDSVWTLLCILVAASSASAIGGVRGTTTMSHTPVRITGDSGFTSTNGVVAGTGVPADPYFHSLRAGLQDGRAHGCCVPGPFP